MNKVPVHEAFNLLHSKEVKEAELELYRVHSEQMKAMALALDAEYKAQLLAYRNKVLSPIGWSYESAVANQVAKW